MPVSAPSIKWVRVGGHYSSYTFVTDPLFSYTHPRRFTLDGLWGFFAHPVPSFLFPSIVCILSHKEKGHKLYSHIYSLSLPQLLQSLRSNRARIQWYFADRIRKSLSLSILNSFASSKCGRVSEVPLFQRWLFENVWMIHNSFLALVMTQCNRRLFVIEYL